MTEAARPPHGPSRIPSARCWPTRRTGEGHTCNHRPRPPQLHAGERRAGRSSGDHGAGARAPRRGRGPHDRRPADRVRVHRKRGPPGGVSLRLWPKRSDQRTGRQLHIDLRDGAIAELAVLARPGHGPGHGDQDRRLERVPPLLQARLTPEHGGVLAGEQRAISSAASVAPGWAGLR